MSFWGDSFCLRYYSHWSIKEILLFELWGFYLIFILYFYQNMFFIVFLYTLKIWLFIFKQILLKTISLRKAFQRVFLDSTSSRMFSKGKRCRVAINQSASNNLEANSKHLHSLTVRARELKFWEKGHLYCYQRGYPI